MRPLDDWLQDPATRDGAGWLHEADDVFNARLDPREGFMGSINCGWCGEDAQGLWFARDPYCALLEDPEVWPVYLAISSGETEVTQHDRESLSAFDFALKAHAVAALNRAERRRWSEQP